MSEPAPWARGCVIRYAHIPTHATSERASGLGAGEGEGCRPLPSSRQRAGQHAEAVVLRADDGAGPASALALRASSVQPAALGRCAESEDDCCSLPTLEFDDDRLMARSGIVARRPTLACHEPPPRLALPCLPCCLAS